MEVPFVEQMKIQAQLLVPLVKTLRAELGKGRADALVRKALGDVWRKFGDEWWRQLGSIAPEDKLDRAFKDAFAAGDALYYEIINKSADAFDLNVKKCKYAKFYEELGEPELGFLLICSQDFPMTDGFGPEVELERTQTLMQGASHCDFRYRLKHKKAE